MQPQQVLQERGTPVYSCTCSCGDEAVQAVLKEGNCASEVRADPECSGEWGVAHNKLFRPL